MRGLAKVQLIGNFHCKGDISYIHIMYKFFEGIEILILSWGIHEWERMYKFLCSNGILLFFPFLPSIKWKRSCLHICSALICVPFPWIQNQNSWEDFTLLNRHSLVTMLILNIAFFFFFCRKRIVDYFLLNALPLYKK